MHDIRLIATDLDFTLLNEQFELSETTKEILERILASGVEIVPCSSRPLSEIPEWFRKHEKVHWLVTANGGAIIDNHSGKVVQANTLSSQRAKQLLTLTESIDPYWSCLIDGHLHSHLAILDDRATLKISGSYLNNILKNRIWESSKDFLDALPDAQVAKIHFITGQVDPENLQLIQTETNKKEALMRLLVNEEDIVLTSSHLANLEIVHPRASKGSAIKWLMETLHCTPEETIACGDNANDLSMLKEVVHSVAVANATAEVLEACRHHALSYQEDGAARMMEQLVFHQSTSSAD